MSYKLLDDRQVVNRSALPISIGSSANITLDALFAQIDSVMVNLNGTQTLTNKTLSFLKTNVVTDSTTTGTAATLVGGDTSVGTVRVTNGSLVSISGIPAGLASQYITIENQTGNTISVNNNDASVSAANRIFTGTGASLTMPANASYNLVYDSTVSRWMLLGTAGAAPAKFAPTVQILTFNNTPFTAIASNGSPTLTGVSNFTGLFVGMGISGTDIAGGAFITALNPGLSTITMSANATGGAPTFASLVLQDLTYTAQTAGPSGNSITVSYTTGAAPTSATLTLQDITYTAVTPGTSGNSITVSYTTGGVAGSEVVSVIGDAISVQIQNGVSTATQVLAAINASAPATALVSGAITGTGSNPQTAPASGSLSGGAAAVIAVTVISNAISVQIQSGVTTASQILAAINASAPATALVSVAVSGTGSNPQTAPASGSLSGGAFNTVTITPTGSGTYVTPTSPAPLYIEVEMVGGGGGGGLTNGAAGGGGGGSGGYIVSIIASPAATYIYTVGTFGSGASGSQTNGGAGGSGVIVVREYYQ